MNRSRFPLRAWLESLRHSRKESELLDAKQRVWANLQSTFPASQPMKSLIPSRVLLAGGLTVLVLGGAILTPQLLTPRPSSQITQTNPNATYTVAITRADGTTVSANVDASTLEQTPSGTFGYVKKASKVSLGMFPTAHAAGDIYEPTTFYDHEGSIYSYNLTTRENVQLLPGGENSYYDTPRYTTAGQLVAAGHSDAAYDRHYSVVIVRPATGERIFETNGADYYSALSWSPDGTKLLMTSKGEYAVLDTTNLQIKQLNFAAANIQEAHFSEPALYWETNSRLLLAQFEAKPGISIPEESYSDYDKIDTYFNRVTYTFDISTNSLLERTPISKTTMSCLLNDGGDGVKQGFFVDENRNLIACNTETEVTTPVPGGTNVGTYTLGISDGRVQKILIEHITEDGNEPNRYSLIDTSTNATISQFTIPKEEFSGTLFLIGNSDYAVTMYASRQTMRLVNVRTGQSEVLR